MVLRVPLCRLRFAVAAFMDRLPGLFLHRQIEHSQVARVGAAAPVVVAEIASFTIGAWRSSIRRAFTAAAAWRRAACPCSMEHALVRLGLGFHCLAWTFVLFGENDQLGLGANALAHRAASGYRATTASAVARVCGEN
jgi:hypothetical protein